jgi:hypothetical protein
MRSLFVLVASMLIALSLPQLLNAQGLSPRAYVITPVHANALTLTYSYSGGDIIFGSIFPVTGASGDIHISSIALYHALNLLGRSANFTIVMPYTVANFRGEVAGSNATAYRSGLMDLVLRFSVNLKGAPAMQAEEYRKWRQKTIIGASVKVIAPTGQYDPAKLINPGANRWAFKPELGLSQRLGHWLLDGYGAVWFFTPNHDYFPGTNTLTQAPVGAMEAHLSYDVKPRFWASLDGNFWYGGRTTTDGVEVRPTLQANSRVGVTCSVPVSKHQSLKFSYSHGARIRFGGNSQNVQAAWQYSWLGKPR